MKKLAVILLTLALVIGLSIPMAIPAAASPDTIWTIGTFDDSRSEFNHIDFDGVDSATYDVDTDDASDFPAFLYVSGYSGSWEEEGVHDVTINFSLDKDYVNVTLKYRKAGGETDEVSLNGGAPQTVTGPGENIFQTYELDLGNLSSGSYYIVIECVSLGTGEGAHSYDALELTGDEIGIELTKSGPECAHEGEIITYTYEVHNTGDVPLTAPIVTDSLGIAVTGVDVSPADGYNDGDANTDDWFDPCETWLFTADYEVPTPQIPDVENEAEAIAAYDLIEVSDTDTHVVDIFHPELSVDKWTSEEAYYNGTVVGYNYKVTNTGDCNLSNVSLMDDNGTPDPGDDVTITLNTDFLEPTDFATGSASFELTCPADNYTFSVRINIATAEGTDIQGMTVTAVDAWKVIIFQWQPRTIGYWGNWDNHWSTAEMSALVRWVNVQSDYFGDGDHPTLTVGNVSDLLLASTKKGKMDADKAESLLVKQLLAAWLSVKSYEGWTDTNPATPSSPDAAMNPNAMVYLNGTAISVIDLLHRIESGVIPGGNVGDMLYAKDILEDLNSAESNSYEMFIPNPICQVVLYEKDPATWEIVAGGAQGALFFNCSGNEFQYLFYATGLKMDGSYSLIYYADPWPGNGMTNSTGAEIATGTASGGILTMSGCIDLGTDLPNSDDYNAIAPCACYPCPGAKIWLVPSADYNAGTCAMIAWNPTAYLYEFNSITYDDTDA